MTKKQIIGVASAVLLVVVLFSLPKVVVDNGKENMASEENEVQVNNSAVNIAEASEPEDHDDHEGHDHEASDHTVHGVAELSTSQLQQLQLLKENFENAVNKEKSAIFADSIAQVYANAAVFDSAAHYAELAYKAKASLERKFAIGNYYYEASGRSMDVQVQRAYSQKAQKYLKDVLEEQPQRLDAKAKLAMTYVATETPMKGILMLREVLEKDPKNIEALYNLGILSFQTNQYDKAVERFNELTKIDPSNIQGQFYLALSYLQLGEREKAKERLLKVKALESDPAVLAAVDSYLEKL